MFNWCRIRISSTNSMVILDIHVELQDGNQCGLLNSLANRFETAFLLNLVGTIQRGCI